MRRARISQLTMLVVVFALCGPATPARADWLLVPFAGTSFGGQTALISLEGGTNAAQTVFGVSAAWLSNQLIGFEADLLYGPSFFERGSGINLIVGSYVSTLSGGVIIAVPLSITRESLRPYVTGGVGVMRAGIHYSAEVFAEDRTFGAIQLGGGAIGFVSRRTGYRFDLRHVRSLSREDARVTGTRQTNLSFWRLTIGLAVRVG